MRHEKIIQIIPAPADMFVEYDDEGTMAYSRVVCLALMEDDSGIRYVTAMDAGEGDPDIDFVCSNRTGFVFGKLEDIKRE